jgi:hypothetical protein
VLGEGVHKAPFTPLYDDFLRENQHAIWPEVGCLCTVFRPPWVACVLVLLFLSPKGGCPRSWVQVLKRQTTLQQQFKEQRALQEGLTHGSLQDIKAFLRNYDRYEQTARCAHVVRAALPWWWKIIASPLAAR